MAVLTMGMTWAVVSIAATPDPFEVERYALTPKIDRIRTDPPVADVYFVGDSIVHRSIDPSVLDPALAAAGCAVRTFNLGAPSLTPEEAKEAIDIARAASPEARFVVGTLAEHVASTEVAFEFKDALFLGPDDIDDVRRMGRVDGVRSEVEAAAAALAAQVPVGHLHYRLFPDRIQELDRVEHARSLVETGYESLESAARFDGSIQNRATLAQRRMDAYGFDEWFRRAGERPVEAEATMAAWDVLIDHIDDPRTLLVLPPAPQWRQFHELETAWRARSDVPVVAIHDPIEHPYLLDRSSWFDALHLAEPGAERASLALAEPLCAAMQDT